MVEPMTSEPGGPAAPAGGSGDGGDRGRRSELFAAILLGVTALLTAWAAYQAAIEGGNSLEAFLESNRLSTQAADLNGLGDQEEATNQALFVEYVTAVQAGNVELADYVRNSLMSDEAYAAIEWWEAQGDDGPDVPFVEENPDYTNESYVEAAEIDEQSEAKFIEGGKLDKRGDRFDLAAVFLAATLFFAGIATIFQRERFQYALLIIGAVMLAGGTAAVVIAHGT